MRPGFTIKGSAAGFFVHTKSVKAALMAGKQLQADLVGAEVRTNFQSLYDAQPRRMKALRTMKITHHKDHPAGEALFYTT
jgi:hypothetical protein